MMSINHLPCHICLHLLGLLCLNEACNATSSLESSSDQLSLSSLLPPPQELPSTESLSTEQSCTEIPIKNYPSPSLVPLCNKMPEYQTYIIRFTVFTGETININIKFNFSKPCQFNWMFATTPL